MNHTGSPLMHSGIQAEKLLLTCSVMPAKMRAMKRVIIYIMHFYASKAGHHDCLSHCLRKDHCLRSAR
jgi:hypothetical protein